MTTNQTENIKETLFDDKEQYLRFKKLWASAVQTKYLGAQHHMLYNIVRGHDTSRGFTFVTKTTKLNNGFRINHGEYFAFQDVQRCMRYAQTNPEYLKHEITALTSDEFNLDWWCETLKKIDGKVKVTALESNFAKGMKIAQEIIKRKAKPITYQDLWDLYEEAA